jgi:hypothetical protein
LDNNTVPLQGLLVGNTVNVCIHALDFCIINRKKERKEKEEKFENH